MELNHRHTDFQSVALPTELSGLIKKGLFKIQGISNTTHSKKRFGAVGETRTPTGFLPHDPEPCVSTNSTTTALKLLTIVRWPEVELNHRHTDFQSVALPTELSGPLKEGLCGTTESSSAVLRKERSVS